MATRTMKRRAVMLNGPRGIKVWVRLYTMLGSDFPEDRDADGNAHVCEYDDHSVNNRGDDPSWIQGSGYGASDSAAIRAYAANCYQRWEDEGKA